MLQAISHGLQLPDRPVDLICLGAEYRPVDLRIPFRCEHLRYFLQRESCGLPERNQRQPFENVGIERAAQSSPASRSDQPFSS